MTNLSDTCMLCTKKFSIIPQKFFEFLIKLKIVTVLIVSYSIGGTPLQQFWVSFFVHQNFGSRDHIEILANIDLLFCRNGCNVSPLSSGAQKFKGITFRRFGETDIWARLGFLSKNLANIVWRESCTERIHMYKSTSTRTHKHNVWH